MSLCLFTVHNSTTYRLLRAKLKCHFCFFLIFLPFVCRSLSHKILKWKWFAYVRAKDSIINLLRIKHQYFISWTLFNSPEFLVLLFFLVYYIYDVFESNRGKKCWTEDGEKRKKSVFEFNVSSVLVISTNISGTFIKRDCFEFTGNYRHMCVSLCALDKILSSFMNWNWSRSILRKHDKRHKYTFFCCRLLLMRFDVKCNTYWKWHFVMQKFTHN